MKWDDQFPASGGAPLEDEQLFLPDAFPDVPAPAPARAPTRAPSRAPARTPVPPIATPVPGPATPPPPGAEVDDAVLAEIEWTAPAVLPTGRILAVVNQKGGVGKTTSTINLGAALAEEGARVLLVDFDPQGALSVGLGLNPNGLEVTVYNLLLDATVTFDEVVAPSRIAGLDIIPANIDLAGAEVMLVSEVAREQSLRRGLAPVRDRYNYILIDCPPSLGLLTVNALTAADAVLIPLECEYFALRGMALLMDTIRKIQERINPQLQIEGILATMLDGRTLHGREVLSRVTDAFGDKLFKTIIHKTIKFAEAPVVGEPIVRYAPKSGGAKEYRDLAREVMSK
ncbi:MAG TPA: ParA family protein [Actinomycetota bacterium]|nr:ParA family protein [Actinomycetota bacterium]